MSIIPQELKLYKSKAINNTASNGGRLSGTDEVISNVQNNVFPSLTAVQLLSGIVLKRKLGYKVANDQETIGSNAYVGLDQITPGSGRVRLFESANTARDTQGVLTGSERLLGVGQLSADVSASATSIVVNAEAGAGAEAVFQSGDAIRLSDGSNEEFVTASAVAWSGDQATITLSAGLVNGYSAASPTVVSACVEKATVSVSVNNWSESSGSGSYDEATHPLEGDNIGTVEETWTLTFSSATNFSVSGDTLGSIGSGTTGGDFSPNNPDFAKPYFILRAAGFSGTWANGDSITFDTHMATVDFWADLNSPAGAVAGADSTAFFIYIESP